MEIENGAEIGKDYKLFFTKWPNRDNFEPRKDAINGVYACRLKKPFARLRGESTVLYIGKANQDSGRNKRPKLWHRLMNYRQNNIGASLRLKRVEEESWGKAAIGYAYCECVDPENTERDILSNYCEQHLELPPLNRAR